MVEMSLHEQESGYVLRLVDMTSHKEPLFIEVALDRKDCNDILDVASTLADRLIGCVYNLRYLIIEKGL